MIINSARQRYREVAWLGFDRIVEADTSPNPDLRWWQLEYRSVCGTGCCYAGHLALAAGGRWLMDIRDRQMVIDGTPITKTDLNSVPYSLWQYMVATVDDPRHLVHKVRRERVIHVSHRAAHLIGLDPDADHLGDEGLFGVDNTREDLERLITEQVGPRP